MAQKHSQCWSRIPFIIRKSAFVTKSRKLKFFLLFFVLLDFQKQILALGFLGCKGTVLAQVQLPNHQYPKVLSGRALLNPSIPQLVSIGGIAEPWGPMCRNLKLDLLRSYRAHGLRLSRTLWITYCPSNLFTVLDSVVPSANLLRARVIPLLMMWMNILETISSSTDHWGTSLITELLPNIDSLSSFNKWSSHQILILGIWREGGCRGLCKKPYQNSDSWHQQLFPGPFTTS